MPTVTNTVKYPNGTVAAGRVTIDLVGDSGRPLTTGAYVSASDYAIEASYSADLAAGVWSVALVANSLINPAGTRWRVTESVDGRLTTYYLEVPDGAGPYFVEDILDDAPGTIASSALQAHEDTASAHGVSFDAGDSGAAKTLDITNGDVQRIRLTAATPALTLAIPTGTRPRGFSLRVTQDGSGSRVPSWVNVVWPGGVVPAGSTGAGDRDRYDFLWDVGDSAWEGVLSGTNFS